ncbi:MAG: glutamine-hydrolyzing carbamoyl-phosphate synthase small subunit [Pseudomonadota bacterium]|jgi:carbamoyl-phosphate synthase small subunit|nr:glutamine-hydrolyzing carbamoyl-phosphate synthase small subunit [Pseudomonadota bacterium]MEC7703234.1 glutamine-hydrolyzing carbamoyl-phosphate synthase small subunit [Pseudomonadota bacterium]MEC9236054.1 glutamine-hydrolyzing carbamoyl-phosphate synthase small subunit [Pseudomonadota bacterium]MED5423625.1 glutamine-hydrolyzing carbamoyl-phosphate synthase small subunit [Pseudomonadota bacterium]MEE3323339.1 glutamine-hydrolyzing carbamoyl-phosphate synthase small subunit [Pseudomonadota
MTNFAPQPKNANALIMLEDGTIFWGKGYGAEKLNIGEICFNTSMSGYQEILTDPSYAGQIITFTFPHIGNVGVNEEDIESPVPQCLGLITREYPTAPSNWRTAKPLTDWLAENNLPAISGVDTRALTQQLRDNGSARGAIAYKADGQFNLDEIFAAIEEWSGLSGLNLAKTAQRGDSQGWDSGLWQLGQGFQNANDAHATQSGTFKVVALDFGAKDNIMRGLTNAGCNVTLIPGTSSFDEIMKHSPDGVFLSNGPGDPAATYAEIKDTLNAILKSGLPLFGICLGHQLLALTLGGQTRKMKFGHRGANHPVKDLTTGKVEITSQNHGFEVVADSLPSNVNVTHISLFDESCEGIACADMPAFSVQHHPEASPGPHDSHYLFDRFVNMMHEKSTKKAA